MGIKAYTFGFAMLRWIALVALALLPTIILMVAYRKYRGEPLWTLADLPVAAEVTLCLAWVSFVSFAAERLHVCFSPGLTVQVLATVAASLVGAIPVMIGYYEIAELRRRLGLEALA